MTIQEALQIKNRLRADAEFAADARTEALCAQYPEIRKIDEELSSFGPSLVAAAMRGETETLEKLEKDNLELQKKRAALLERFGLRPDEDAPKYACAACKDSGYVGLSLCGCVKKLIATDAYRSAGLGKGLTDKTFDNFRIAFYEGEDREQMERILEFCRRYVANFTEESAPVLFIGKTGLGKTHLSAAIACGVAEKGYRVVYESAQKLYDTYESARFGKDPASVERTELYENCALLIVDDLGTECSTQYTAATFFNLLNTRLINRKPILINTNLNKAQLEKTYGERVLSRLFGEFKVLLFKGKDVRMQKIGG